MASAQQVKKYVAYWFQLGKKVVFPDGKAELPESVVEGNRYSPNFERCWERVLTAQSGCHLEGTEQSIQDLLSSTWEIAACARCSMPIPTIDRGIQSLECPCSDLDLWPNTELPAPRSPVNSSSYLNNIRQRLKQDY